MLIRAETPADHDAVLAVVRQAFGEEHGGTVAGHTMVGRNLLDAPPGLVDVGVLSPLAVRPDVQRRGIGRALVAAAVEASAGYPALFLEGDPRHYGPLGFRPGAGLGFRRPSLRIPPAAFQVRLSAGYEEWMTGTLVHDPLFWDLDAVGLR